MKPGKKLTTLLEDIQSVDSTFRPITQPGIQAKSKIGLIDLINTINGVNTGTDAPKRYVYPLDTLVHDVGSSIVSIENAINKLEAAKQSPVIKGNKVYIHILKVMLNRLRYTKELLETSGENIDRLTF